jgi:hypothetical protein
LGRFAAFMTRYLPNVSDWLLKINREKINREFTAIGGEELSADKTEMVDHKSIYIDH